MTINESVIPLGYFIAGWVGGLVLSFAANVSSKLLLDGVSVFTESPVAVGG